MKIIINESQYKLINEAMKTSSFQNILNETLKMLKDAVQASKEKYESGKTEPINLTLSDAEEEPRDFRAIFSDNIDNVKSIDIVSIDKEYIRSDVKLIINVVVTLDFDIFGKWEAIAEILGELQYYMKPEMMINFKLQLADNGVIILNNIEMDI
jgi:glycosylphosphatidylinositol transamidase (GPIT) subunit GPI8